MRILSITALLLAASCTLAACPKGGEPASSGDQEPTEPAVTSRFSGLTRTFVDGLGRAPFVGWEVADDGAAVIYDSLVMREDGSFQAETSLRLGEEPLRCTERGTWALGAWPPLRANGPLRGRLHAAIRPGRPLRMSNTRRFARAAAARIRLTEHSLGYGGQTPGRRPGGQRHGGGAQLRALPDGLPRPDHPPDLASPGHDHRGRRPVRAPLNRPQGGPP